MTRLLLVPVLSLLLAPTAVGTPAGAADDEPASTGTTTASDGRDVLAGTGGLHPPAVADVPAGPRKGRVLVINGVPLGGGRPALLSLDRG